MSVIIGPDGEAIGGEAPASSSAAAPAAPGAGGDIIDGSDATFMQDVVEESRTRPVIVDFWAPWCGPCKQLGPALEKAVTQARGAVRLVKINVDENQGVAQQLRVQSIPAVFAIKDGRPVDGFQGAVPESQIKQFVDRLTGDTGAEDAAAAVAEGDRALGEDDPRGAAQFYAQALQIDPDNAAAVAGLARCYLAAGEPGEAKNLLESIPEEMKSDPAIQAAMTALKYAEADTDPSEVEGLKQAVEAAPDDHQKRLDLAKALSARGRFGEAMEHLLTSVEKDREWNEGAAKAELLSLFEAAGPASDATKAGRKRLSSILFA